MNNLFPLRHLRSRLPRFAALLGLSAVAATVACSAGGQANTTAKGPSGAPPVPISTAEVERKPMPLAINVIGQSEAFHTVAVRAQVTGTLTAVKFTEGADVTAGQVIFEIDRRPLEAALLQAQAMLARDAAQEASARTSAARYQDLMVRGIATKDQTEQARAAADALTATLEADRAAVENAKVQLQYATITAPISGRTGELLVHEGNLVNANGTAPLVVINQVSPIYVSFGVPEGQLADLKRYLAQGSVKLEARAPNETIPSEGRITFIDNSVDATTGQIKVKGVFTNADRRLWPGQFANVAVTLKTDPNAIVVPAVAVQNGQQGPYVFVVKADKTVDIRNIVVDRQSSESAVIKKGLAPGEIVVTDGHLRLVSGANVSIKSGPSAPTAKSLSQVEP